MTDQWGIIKESEYFFYKTLYSKNDDYMTEINLKEYLKDSDIPKLSDNESNH